MIKTKVLSRIHNNHDGSSINIDRLKDAVASEGIGCTYSFETSTCIATKGNLVSKANVSYKFRHTNHADVVTSFSNGNTYGCNANRNQTSGTIGWTAYELSYDAENRQVYVVGILT